LKTRNKMKKLVLVLLSLAIASGVFAGTETYSGKEMKQVVPPPCPQWYVDNEFNVGLWAHIFLQETNGPTILISRPTTPGAVASISNTFSIVISVLAWKAG
jgi:hypothetical protein